MESVFSYGIYVINDGGAKTSVPIGTAWNTPDDPSRYLILGNCVLFPSVTATASIKRGLVTVYDPGGTIAFISIQRRHSLLVESLLISRSRPQSLAMG